MMNSSVGQTDGVSDDLALLEFDEEVPTDGLLTFEEEALAQQRARNGKGRTAVVAFAVIMGLAAIAALTNTNNSTSTMKIDETEITDFSEETPLWKKLAGNHFCAKYMHSIGCAWTKDFHCPGQTEYQGQHLTSKNVASNDQSIGYDCCCTEGFHKITQVDICKADKIVEGYSEKVRNQWHEEDCEGIDEDSTTPNATLEVDVPPARNVPSDVNATEIEETTTLSEEMLGTTVGPIKS